MNESTGIQYQSKSTGEWQYEPILLQDLWNVKIGGQMFIRPQSHPSSDDVIVKIQRLDSRDFVGEPLVSKCDVLTILRGEK